MYKEGYCCRPLHGVNAWQFVSGNVILYYRILCLSLGCDSSNLHNAISNTKSSTYCYQVYYYTKPIAIYTMILRVYLIQLYDVDAVEFRTRTLIHCDALLYIDKGGGQRLGLCTPIDWEPMLLMGAQRTVIAMHAPSLVYITGLWEKTWKI